MGMPHRATHQSRFVEDGIERMRIGRVGVHRAAAHWLDDGADSQQIGVSEVLVAGLFAGSDRVGSRHGLARLAIGVLRRGLDLPLQFEEVADVQIFGGEPSQVDRVVLGRAGEVDMVVARNPIGGIGPGVHWQGNFARGIGGEFELGGARLVEEAAVGLDSVLAWRQREPGFALQHQIMRFAFVDHFQHGWIGFAEPQPVAVVDVDLDWQHGVYWMQAERRSVAGEIETHGHARRCPDRKAGGMPGMIIERGRRVDQQGDECRKPQDPLPHSAIITLAGRAVSAVFDRVQ